MSTNPSAPDETAVGKPEEYREDLNIILMCPDCKEDPPNLVEEFAQGEIVCGSCGRVLQDHVLDTRSEWNTHTNDYGEQEDHSRVGQAANPLYFGSQLHTEVSFFSRGNKLSKRDRGLQRAQNQANKEYSNEKWNQKLSTMYTKINSLCQSAGLPKTVQDQACFLYKKHFQDPMLKSSPQDGMIASVIILATRYMGVHRGADEVCRIVGINRKILKKAFPKLLEVIRHEDAEKAAQQTTNQDTSPQALVQAQSTIQDMSNTVGSAAIINLGGVVKEVPTTCSKLGISGRLQMQCEQAAQICSDHGLGEGRNPRGRAACCILLVCRALEYPLQEKELAKAANMGIGTIRNLYNKVIEPASDMLIKPEWRPKKQSLLIPA